MAALTNGAVTVALPDELLRTDEFGWSPVRQAVEMTLSGALWIDVSVAQTGEPITLAGGRSGGSVWGEMTRSEFAALRALADLPGEQFTLTWRGESIDVVWRHEDPPALSAEDLIQYPDPLPTDYVIPTLKFTRIA